MDPHERRPPTLAPTPPKATPDAEEHASLRARVYDAVETLTWRATNASGTQLRRGADALRALLDKRRG